MSNFNAISKTIQKKLKELPVEAIPGNYLAECDIEEPYKKFENDILLNLSSNEIPKNFMKDYEIDYDQERSFILSEIGNGEVNQNFLKNHWADEENIKSINLIDQENENTKIPKIIQGINSKKDQQTDSIIKNIEHVIFSKILEKHHIKCLKGNLYLYNDNNGCFVELEEYQIRTLVRTGWSAKIEGLLSKSRVDDIIDRLKSCASIQINEDDLDAYPFLINFKDCVLNIKTEEILKHSQEYCFTSYINANYQNKHSSGEKFLKFIDQCTDGDESKLKQIQELCAYVISNFSNAKKWFVLIGQPHTGKSTILELLTHIIGEENTSNVPLHELGGKFALADLFKKKLNVCGELNEGVLKNTSIIKAITGSDRLRADRKYKLPIYFINRAKLIMAGNSMFQLQTLDNTSAFIDRILFVVFNNTIPENKRDYKLMEKLLSEKDFIVRWSIKGLKRLIKHNFIFTECNDSIEFKKQYKNEMSNINGFVNSMCIVVKGNDQIRVHKRDLYATYANYCRDNCQNMLSKKEFFNEIKKLPIKQSKFRYKKSNPLDGYTGITLKQHFNKEDTIKDSL